MRSATAERATAAAVEVPVERQRSAGEVTRQHAVNVAVGVGALVSCGGAVIWSGARAAGLEVPVELLAVSVPFGAVAGVVAGARALLVYTAEHRAWLYRWDLLESLEPPATNAPGAGAQVPGTMLRGPGGVYRRVELVLTHPELQAVKRVLLAEGKATVRALAAVVGERASLLRAELVRVGICKPPEAERAAAFLSDGGREAVERW